MLRWLVLWLVERADVGAEELDICLLLAVAELDCGAESTLVVEPLTASVVVPADCVLDNCLTLALELRLLVAADVDEELARWLVLWLLECEVEAVKVDTGLLLLVEELECGVVSTLVVDPLITMVVVPAVCVLEDFTVALELRLLDSVELDGTLVVRLLDDVVEELDTGLLVVKLNADLPVDELDAGMLVEELDAGLLVLVLELDLVPASTLVVDSLTTSVVVPADLVVEDSTTVLLEEDTGFVTTLELEEDAKCELELDDGLAVLLKLEDGLATVLEVEESFALALELEVEDSLVELLEL